MGEVPLAALAGGVMVRVSYPPFDVLVAEVNGVVCAIEDACNHAGASLCEGRRLGEDGVLCPMHDYLFNITTGELVTPKGACDAQRVFKVTLEGERVVVWDPFHLVVLK